jgi:hypothetical protein
MLGDRKPRLAAGPGCSNQIGDGITFDSADLTVDGQYMGGLFRLTDEWVKNKGKWQMVAPYSGKVKRLSLELTCPQFPHTGSYDGFVAGDF